MEINYNHQGKWSAEAVKRRYSDLRVLTGGAEGFDLNSRTYTNKGGITWIYNIMDAVVDGVRLGDNACVQLSIDYIEDNVIPFSALLVFDFSEFLTALIIGRRCLQGCRGA